MDSIILEINKKNIILKSLIDKKETYNKNTPLYNLFELIIRDFHNDTSNNLMEMLNLTKVFFEKIDNKSD
jgi:hypothetical protein